MLEVAPKLKLLLRDWSDLLVVPKTALGIFCFELGERELMLLKIERLFVVIFTFGVGEAV